MHESFYIILVRVQDMYYFKFFLRSEYVVAILWIVDVVNSEWILLYIAFQQMQELFHKFELDQRLAAVDLSTLTSANAYK